MAKITQWMEVVSALENLGGIATLSQLSNSLLGPGGAGLSWATKTPEATIRRIVRNTPNYIHAIKPGLYCLREHAESYEDDYSIALDGEVHSNVVARNHWYYQGLLTEIGNERGYNTFIPAQDKNRAFGSQKLGEICTSTKLPSFGYRCFVRRARTVDVIWLNHRDMLSKLFEVEFSTDMLNSLVKFNELRDFYAQFSIVAPPHRQNHFVNRIEMDTFRDIRKRVTFISTDQIDKKQIPTRD